MSATEKNEIYHIGLSEMVTNWTINGGRESSTLYHVSKEGAEYAKRSVHGTMGNLLNSYNQNRGRFIIFSI